MMTKKKVLLVDDDQVFNLLNKKTLQHLDVASEIKTAYNGQEAIRLIRNDYKERQSMPEVILLDLNMPLMDGFGFIEAFKNLNVPEKEKTKIIIVTSSEDPRDMVRAKKMGIREYLSKPLTMQAMQDAMNF